MTNVQVMLVLFRVFFEISPRDDIGKINCMIRRNNDEVIYLFCCYFVALCVIVKDWKTVVYHKCIFRWLRAFRCCQSMSPPSSSTYLLEEIDKLKFMSLSWHGWIDTNNEIKHSKILFTGHRNKKYSKNPKIAYEYQYQVLYQVQRSVPGTRTRYGTDSVATHFYIVVDKLTNHHTLTPEGVFSICWSPPHYLANTWNEQNNNNNNNNKSWAHVAIIRRHHHKKVARVTRKYLC